jgi:predicted Zn-dependent protease
MKIPLLIISLLSLSPVVFAYGQFKTYSDPILGISIDYPDGWEVNSEQDGVVFHNPNNTFLLGKIIEFVVTVNDVDTSLDEYVRQSLSEDREFDLAIISTDETTISGNNTAQEVLYTLGQEDKSKVMAFITLNNDIGYTVSFYVTPETDFQNYIPIMQTMIDSFRIL